MHLVWHRGDLRTHDHPALAAAARAGSTLGLVVLDPNILGATSPRRRALFKRNVHALREAYEARGGVLVVHHGEPAEVLVGLVDALATVERIHAIASYTPYGVHRDTAAVRALRNAAGDPTVGPGIRWYDGAYVHSPGTVRTADDSFYSVFSPFFRRWRSLGTPDPLEAPHRIATPELDPGFDPGDIALDEPDVPLPDPGEAAALEALERFIDERLPGYDDRRDRLDGDGTSHLSVYLTLGALSARTAAARVEAAAASGAGSGGAHIPAEAARKWLSELAWRDFLADLLYHRPDLPHAPFQPRWTHLDWPGDERRFQAWRDGETGVPTVDAALRQLRETGWISNRARMVAAQFLAKNLRVDWRRGEKVFKDWLLDGDTASNLGNWQWAAGLGVDNAPYFRVMNPVTQGRKHDPDGEWVGRWAPDVADRDKPHEVADPVADPGASRRAYLDAADAVPGAEDAAAPPEPRRPGLSLATAEQLRVIQGIGPATADAILDAVADGNEHSLEEAPGIGPETAEAVRDRFGL